MWECLAQSGLIWSNIMSQVISWLRREWICKCKDDISHSILTDFPVSGRKTMYVLSASTFILIGGCIISCSPSKLSFPALSTTHAYTPPTNFVVFDKEAEQLISPRSSSYGWVPQIPQQGRHCLCSVNCPVEGEGMIKLSSLIYREAIVTEWPTLEQGQENIRLGRKS